MQYIVLELLLDHRLKAVVLSKAGWNMGFPSRVDIGRWSENKELENVRASNTPMVFCGKGIREGVWKW